MKKLMRIFGVAGLLAAMGGAAHADILPEGYGYRRALQFKQIVSDAPGVNLAVVEFYTNGEAKGDGSDIRVTNGERMVVASRVMQVSANSDFVRVVFATSGDGPYYVYWGNPKAEAGGGVGKDKELEVKRGIYAEILKVPGNAGRETKSAEGMEKLFERGEGGKGVEGAVFVPEIFLGYNPLGEEWDTMFHYWGQFKIDKEMTASFAFTVSNSGTLKIDGKQIAQEFHGQIRGRVRDPKEVDLAAGWHSIEVTEVNLDGGHAGVVVAWKRPGDKDYSPLPWRIFAPVATAVAGNLEKVGGAGGGGYAADFGIVPEGEAFSPPESYLQRYTFDAEFPATFKPKLSWDFGDGQVGGDEKRAGHIYFLPGNYTVKLKVEQGGNVFTAARRIVVKDRMYSKFPKPPEDAGKTVEAVLRQVDLKKLTGEQAMRGMMYFKEQGDTNNEAAWGKAWAASKDSVRGDVAFDEAFDLARLLEMKKEYKDAAEIFRAASGKQTAMEMRTQLMRYYVMTACDYADDAEGALKVAQDWKKLINETSPQQVAGMRAAIVYAAVAKGDGKLAQATLAEAGDKEAKGAGYNERQIRQGVLARNIENYIRTKDFDTALKLVDDWDVEFPEAIWEGFTRTLRVKLEVAEGRPLVAARMGLAHAKANPGGFYAAELLYRAAENFKAGGDAASAKGAMDLLTSKYPESPYARGDEKGK